MITFPEGHAASTSSRKTPPRISFSQTAARWLNRFDWFALGLVAVCAVGLHFRFITHVGGLWRDEVNTVNLATLPTLGDIWRFLEFDSFPILYHLVVRAWCGIFGPANDAALRVLGLLIGLGVLGVLWANARSFGSHLPLLSLALVGLNPMMIRYGDSNRAYGLGILLILLTMRSFWRLVERPARPSAKRIAFAGGWAVLSVQCLYYNSVLLFAIAAGAVCVAMRARAWRTVVIVLGLGAIAAASLAPYVPIFVRMRDWTFLVSYPATFSWLWERVGEVLGSPEPWAIWLWLGLVVGALTLTFVLTVRKHPEPSPESARLPASMLFAVATLVVGVIGYALFLRTLNYYTQPWYYITLTVFAACALDVIFGVLPQALRGRSASLAFRSFRPLVAILFLAFTLPLSWEVLLKRHTNVDFIAAEIERHAQEGDIVLVPRWECAISFSRYYNGKGELVSVPPIDDHRFHRYDLIIAQMKKVDAVQPVLTQMEQALRSGHSVFFADSLSVGDLATPWSELRPAYRDQNGGWHGASDNSVWRVQVGRFLHDHAAQAFVLKTALPRERAVQDFERLSPGVARGWKE